MGLVVSLLSHAFRKRPRVTFVDPSPKRRRYGKEVIKCGEEPSLPETRLETGQSSETRPEAGPLSVDDCKDIEIDTRSVRRDLLEKRRKAREFLEGNTVAVPLPDGVVTYVDRGLFVSFQAEHQEDMYWWCLDQYKEDSLERFSFELDML